LRQTKSRPILATFEPWLRKKLDLALALDAVHRAVCGSYAESRQTEAAMRTFEGRMAVITGGGTGVGAAVALALAKAGATVHLIGRRSDLLQSIAAKARNSGSEATYQSGDLATDSGQLEICRHLTRDLAYIDILILNAAMYVAGPIERASLADFDKTYRTNVRAPYVLTQKLLPMLKARRGQVVFINSSSGIAAKPMSSQYDSTKHALKAIADSLRGEANPNGVRVLSVYLGRTASEMQERIHRMDGKPYRPDLLLQPEDVASIILSALSLPHTAEVTDIHIRPMIKT
jgi:NADP-dependent 3-hydroxy acid dehydrogenase YdfG